jgi:hypothetical protein
MMENLWDTHDFMVKMLDWSAARGSRLAAYLPPLRPRVLSLSASSPTAYGQSTARVVLWKIP